MTLYVQRHCYTIFSVIPSGGIQCITDTPDPLPPGPPQTTHFRHWNLPAWFPRKTLISRVVVMYESAGYNTIQQKEQYPVATADVMADLREYAFRELTAEQFKDSRGNMETMIWVDPQGQHYLSATPPGAENSDFSKMTVLMHEFTSDPMMNYDTGDLRYPIAFDRDAGDKLAVQLNNADPVNWLAVAISIVLPAPFQPTALTG